jgi:hypothetical protein
VHRSLVQGGGFRIVVPDADLIYEKLAKGDVSFFRNWMERDNVSLAEAFRVLIGHPRDPLDEDEFRQKLATLPKMAFLDWCKEGLEYDLQRTGEHINWFNFEKMKSMLQQAGFSQIHLSAAQQSIFYEARGLRFDTRPSYSLHVDCIK